MYLVVGQSTPLGPAGLFLPAACCVVYVFPALLAGDYALRVAAFFLLPDSRANGRPPSGSRRWRWLVLPIAGVLVASTVFYNWPLAVRFSASRSAFEGEVSRLIALPLQDPNNIEFNYYDGESRVGLYHVSSRLVFRNSDGAAREVDFGVGGFMFGSWGFRYDVGNPQSRSRPELPVGWSIWANMK